MFYIELYNKAGEIHKLPIITTLSDISDAGPVSYSLNNPPGTTMSMGTDQIALSIAQDSDNWYLQATTEWNTSHWTPPTLPFDYFVFNATSSHPYLKYGIKMKDANADTIFILSDSSGNTGVGQMIVSKAVADFDLSYS